MNLNLNGGPSKNAAQLSSLPVTSRYGRLCLMSTLLMTLLCPVISPTEEPLSHRKTAPNLYPTRGTTEEKSVLGKVSGVQAAELLTLRGQCCWQRGPSSGLCFGPTVRRENTEGTRTLTPSSAYRKNLRNKCLEKAWMSVSPKPSTNKPPMWKGHCQGTCSVFPNSFTGQGQGMY